MPAALAVNYPPADGWRYRWFGLNYGGRIPDWKQWLHELIAEWQEVPIEKIEMGSASKNGHRLKAIYRILPTDHKL